MLVTKLLNKQSSCQWFVKPWRSCDVTVTVGWWVVLPIFIYNNSHNNLQYDPRCSISDLVCSGDIIITTLTFKQLAPFLSKCNFIF